MANPPTSHLSLHKGEQLSVADTELPRESSGLPMDFPASAGRKGTFGMLAPESEDESETQQDFRMLALLSSSPKPEHNSGMRETSSPSRSPEHQFGMGITPTSTPPPERKHNFGMGLTSTSPRSPEGKYNFGMDLTPTPPRLPKRKHNFGMGIMPSPESKDDFGMHATLSTLPVPKKKSNFRFKEPLFLPESEDDFEMQAPVSPLPHAEDFGIIPISDEGPSETGTHQPTEAKEPLGSSSKERAWIWGERAPSPTDNKQEGQPSMIRQVDRMHELSNPQTHALILRGQANVLQSIHGVLSNTYGLQQTLSRVMDAMIDELEGAEVQETT